MKRPPGLWILLIGTLLASLGDVCAVRATSLIFGKSPTSSTTPASNATDVEKANSDVEVVTEAITESSNVTKPPLTGIPQIDYIYDLNLPRALNGYNLSEYPFYERVPDPDKIDFKCDGLHDGFYASIPFKCQVYHHCLFGVRYDFLCANYTAFDQKTFICQFVSEVDCVNSKKFWHRNDALYEAATTTTAKPQVIHTPPPPREPALKGATGRGNAKRRRPLYRRPQYDYYEEEEYDDYYDERPRGRRRRPRPRPIYEDDYEDDYEEVYETRRRRPTRPTRTRNKNRYKDEEEEEVRPKKKRPVDEEEEERPKKKRPIDDEEERPRRKRPTDDEERPKRKRPVDEDYDEKPSRKKNRRPDDEPRNRPRKKDEDTKATDVKPIIKPTSGSSIYDRPRTAPRIKPPVPKSEADKYAYKTVAPKKPPKEEEYYDDYEEEPKEHRSKEQKPKQKEETRRQTRPNKRPSSTPKPKEPEYEYEEYEVDVSRSLEEVKTKATTPKTTTTTPKVTTYKKEEIWEKPEQIVRIVKRPFLPSRGGNPYVSRGLEPVGAKARPEVMERQSTIDKSKFADPISEDDGDFKPVTKANGPRTTQKPKNPLDIIENEYDVTLNDALNPTLPNLPIRASPTGFHSGEFAFQNYQRSRYVLEPAASASSDTFKNHRQRFGEERREYFPPAQEYNIYRSPIVQPNLRNRLTQANTQAYYTSY